jgi:AcrR family transcriptional regulator
LNKKRGPYSSPRQQDRRVRILRAASVQLQKHGLAALTMQSIAEVSEVSTKTLYNLFGSRELLLLEGASERLVDLEQNPTVIASEAGLPRLLSYTVGSMLQFEEMPGFARAIISILLGAELDPDTADQRLGVVQRFAHASLCIASEKGELRDGLDLVELSYLISANQWGAVLLWEKNLLQLEQLKTHISLSHYLTLTPLCQGKRKKVMQAQLEEILARMTETTSERTRKSQGKIQLI